MDKRVGNRGKRCGPSLTRAILSTLEVSSHEKALYNIMSRLQLLLQLPLQSAVQMSCLQLQLL